MIIRKNYLTAIGDEIIKEIENRTNPFETYTLIVPNLLLEQWFKTYWMQKTNSVLMNVEFKRLRPFLYEKFNDEGKEIINSDNLSSLIMNELLKNLKAYEALSKYVMNKGSIDSINLYDLCSSLASLILSYEEDCFNPTGEINTLIEAIKHNEAYSFLHDIVNKDINNDEKVFVFGFYEVKPLFNTALQKLNSRIYLQERGEDKTIDKVYSCASKEREIEHLHSQICRILKEGNEKVCDIVVYAPSLDEYEAIIRKVFNTGEDKDFPQIPYVIVNSEKNDSSTGDALKILYNILYQEQMTRADFVSLLMNPLIQKQRGIDNNKIEVIVNALDSMYVYRDNAIENQWRKGLKRLLLAKLIGSAYNIENKVEIDKDIYLPYGNIELDDECILILSKMLEDIDSFRERFKDKAFFDKDDLGDLKHELDKFFACLDTETNYYYNSVIRTIDNMIEKGKSIPFEILFITLIAHSQKITLYPSNMFTGGVTFINFNKDNIISSKHMFFIGMSSNNLPRKNRNNELDERTDKVLKYIEDENIYQMLLHNADNIYISYVNMDLTTLEEYTYSNLLKLSEENIEKIGMLENRSYEELFTKREIEKKEYKAKLVETKKTPSEERKDLPPFEYPLSVKYKDMASLIEENLMSKINSLFKGWDSSLEKRIKTYEPIFADAITKSNIEQELLLKMIENRSNDLDNSQIDDVIKKYELLSSYPYTYKNKTSELKEKTQKYYDDLKNDFVLEQPFELKLSLIIEGKEELNWKLIVNDQFISKKEENNIHFYFAKVVSKIDDTKLIRLYIISLAYIANLNDDNEYMVHLFEKSFLINKTKAIEILNNLFVCMFDYSDDGVKGFGVLQANSFYKAIDKFNNGAWRYFVDKDLLVLNELNNNENFGSLKDKYINFINKNVLYMAKKEKE